MNRLRIAQLAPLAESVPPRAYGGTERVVSNLTEALVARGHDVTLFAAGDSRTDAELVSVCDRGLRSSGCADPFAYHVLLMEALVDRADDFDVIHSHLDYRFFPYRHRLEVPVVSTMHGRLDQPETVALYDHFDDEKLVSISHAQRRPIAEANWVANVYHGLPLDLYEPCFEPDDYVAFIGRFSPEKRADAAIRAAVSAGYRIKLAAKIDDVDRSYFDREIAGMLRHPKVEFVGEIDEADKAGFLGRAQALMFLVDWPEPFGLAMIEAMACGTPVIARRCGSIPEVVDDGITGFVCDSEADALRRLGGLDGLDRRQVRRRFETRFSSERMADDYEALFVRLVAERAGRRASGSPEHARHPDSRPRSV